MVIGSIPEFCRLMELPPPEHPLVSVIRPELIRQLPAGLPPTVVLNFFFVCLRTQGAMRFFLPGKLPASEIEGGVNRCGWWLLIHPDLLLRCSVFKNLQQYGLFAHAENEVLYLARQEELLMTGILEDIEQGYFAPMDRCAQEAMLGQVETLLCFAERFYRKQLRN